MSESEEKARIASRFYQGKLAKYDAATHGEGIYFATDAKRILMNGDEYLGGIEVKDASLSDDGKTLTITKLDDSTVEVQVGGSGEYESAIEDKTLAMPSAVGGIAKGTTLEELEGKSFNSILDDLLFPTVYPTFTAPSAGIALKSYSSTQEVGATAPTESNFTTTFNAGAITLNGVKQADRAGALDSENSFIYYGGSVSNTTLPETVALGDTSYQYHAAYGEGAQPKDNKGNDYDSPLAAGSVNSSAVKVNGTYPWYASTSSATEDEPVVKQSLVAWNATAGAMSTGQFTLQASGTLPQVFKLPRQLKTLQMLNTVSNSMETIGTTAYAETTETIDINGNEVTYYVYTYNGSTRGEVTLLAKF